MFICNGGVQLCDAVISHKSGSVGQLTPWEGETSLDRILANLPRIAAAGTQVEANLVHWVRRARSLGATWARVGEALGDAPVRLGTLLRRGVSMDVGLRELVGAREGHFLLESGHHGPLWLELDALFLRPERVRPLVDALADQLADRSVDVVCGPLAGGAFLAQALAGRLQARFVHTERTAHTTGELHSAIYEVPAALRETLRNAHVAVVDDVVNAGSATRSTIAAVRTCGGRPVVLAALLRLGDGAAALADDEGLDLVTLDAWPGTLWEPSDCPPCAAGTPLDSV